MDILLKPYISYSLHCIGTNNSRSYIINEKSKNEIMLEGLASDMLAVIVQTGKYFDVLAFAQKNHIEEELEEFLQELYYEDLIESNHFQYLFIDDIFSDSETIDSKEDEKSKKDFYIEKRNYFFENDFLYSLSFSLCESFPQIALQKLYKIVDIAKKIGVSCISLNIDKFQNLEIVLSVAKRIREQNISLVFNFSSSIFKEEFQVVSLKKIVDLFPHKIIFSSSVLKEMLENKNDIFCSSIDFFMENDILISSFNEKTSNIDDEQFKNLVLLFGRSIEMLEENCYNDVCVNSFLHKHETTAPYIHFDIVISNNQRLPFLNLEYCDFITQIKSI